MKLKPVFIIGEDILSEFETKAEVAEINDLTDLTDLIDFTSNEITKLYEGVLVEVTGGSVTIDIKGRLGQLKIPLRMLISQESPQVGQTVRFMMSLPMIVD
jgi:hypothetical protein